MRLVFTLRDVLRSHSRIPLLQLSSTWEMGSPRVWIRSRDLLQKKGMFRSERFGLYTQPQFFRNATENVVSIRTYRVRDHILVDYRSRGSQSRL